MHLNSQVQYSTDWNSILWCVKWSQYGNSKYTSQCIKHTKHTQVVSPSVNPMIPTGNRSPAFVSAAPMLDPKEKLRSSCDSARSIRAASASSAVRKTSHLKLKTCNMYDMVHSVWTNGLCLHLSTISKLVMLLVGQKNELWHSIFHWVYSFYIV